MRPSPFFVCGSHFGNSILDSEDEQLQHGNRMTLVSDNWPRQFGGCLSIDSLDSSEQRLSEILHQAPGSHFNRSGSAQCAGSYRARVISALDVVCKCCECEVGTAARMNLAVRYGFANVRGIF